MFQGVPFSSSAGYDINLLHVLYRDYSDPERVKIMLAGGVLRIFEGEHAAELHAARALTPPPPGVYASSKHIDINQLNVMFYDWSDPERVTVLFAGPHEEVFAGAIAQELHAARAYRAEDDVPDLILPEGVERTVGEMGGERPLQRFYTPV